MIKIKKRIPLIDQHDKNYMYGGKFGGNFIPETLKIPIDDLISKNGDKGIPFLIENNETDAGKKIMEIASYIDKKIK